MSWFWLNIPLGMVFVLAIAGIPLWMVLRHPDARLTGASGPELTPQSRPVLATVPDAVFETRELVGASAGRSSSFSG
jgi:hypothetical protein